MAVTSEWLNTHLNDPATLAIIALYRRLAQKLCEGIDQEPVLPSVDQLLDRAEFEGAPDDGAAALYRQEASGCAAPASS